MGERAYIGPGDAEKLRSGIHTREEIRDEIKEENMIEEEHQKDKDKHREKTMRELESRPQNPEMQELRDRIRNPDKFLTKEEKEERDRESI